MRRSTSSRPDPRNVRRLLVLSGGALFLFCLVIIAFAIRDARQVTRLSDDVRLHYRPLAETAYQLETGVFELGAAAVTYLARRDTVELTRVASSRAALLTALNRYERLADIPPRVSAADAQGRLHRDAVAYVALGDSLVAIVRRAGNA